MELLADEEAGDDIYLVDSKAMDPPPKWAWDLGTLDVVFNVQSAPCWIFRWMQRLMLGIRWRKL